MNNKLGLPRSLYYFTLITCLVPSLIGSLGINVEFMKTPIDSSALAGMSPQEVIDSFFTFLKGGTAHSLLEWTGINIAFFTAILSYLKYKTSNDVTIPIIGMSLLFSGVLDIFHIFAADRLIIGASDNRIFIPFTWVICRLFNVLILGIGISFCLVKKQKRKKFNNKRLLSIFFLSFALLAVLIIIYTLSEGSLPITQFPNNTIKRPYDLIPLVLFISAGLLIYHPYYKMNNNPFSESLLLSVFPAIAAQMHMVFGSSELYDHHFNISHFLKVIAYILPCMGLMYDYLLTHKKQVLAQSSIEMSKLELETVNSALTSVQNEIVKKNKELLLSNNELEKFAYITSHDLKAPLRGISDLTEYIEEDLEEYLSNQSNSPVKKNLNRMHNQVGRMNSLIEGILNYSKVGNERLRLEEVNVKELLNTIIKDQRLPKEASILFHGDMPVFITDPIKLGQVFSNLISNAYKYHHNLSKAEIIISVLSQGNFYEFSVKDNGPGIDKRFHSKIFEIFQTLQSRDDIESTGIGLSIIKKLVEHYGGEINVQSEHGSGSTFIFTWPKNISTED